MKLIGISIDQIKLSPIIILSNDTFCKILKNNDSSISKGKSCICRIGGGSRAMRDDTTSILLFFLK